MPGGRASTGSPQEPAIRVRRPFIERARGAPQGEPFDPVPVVMVSFGTKMDGFGPDRIRPEELVYDLKRHGRHSTIRRSRAAWPQDPGPKTLKELPLPPTRSGSSRYPCRARRSPVRLFQAPRRRRGRSPRAVRRWPGNPKSRPSATAMFTGEIVNPTEGVGRAPYGAAQLLRPARDGGRRRRDARRARRAREGGGLRDRHARRLAAGARPAIRSPTSSTSGSAARTSAPPWRPGRSRPSHPRRSSTPFRLQRRRRRHRRHAEGARSRATTLFIVSSKTFTTQETMTNAQ